MKCENYDCGHCRGTKEMDICKCQGYEERCDFYEYVRERGKKTLKKENNKTQENWHYCPYCGRELK